MRSEDALSVSGAERREDLAGGDTVPRTAVHRESEDQMRAWYAGVAVSVVSLLTPARPALTQDAGLAAALDAELSAAYKPGEPGAAVIVVRDGRTVLRKAYGMASLELGVPMRPEHVFRIGSITKQFTAAAILILAQQGKLGLQDPITRHLPDYPMHSQTITIEHLLTHTSGIRSYTGMPSFWKTMAIDEDLTGMIATFKDEPLEFDPGSKWRYNNSGYFLLGAIIEKVSGQGYAEFLQKNVFAPLGMTHTFYGDNEPIVPNRVQGYRRDGERLVNAAYLSMKKPYAAGSLLSNVDDLALWDASLYTEKLLTVESKRRAFTAYRLSDGRSTHYGLGWGIGEKDGRPTISHGGGINGFLTQAIRIPDARVFVALLTNREFEPGPAPLVRRLAARAAGRPLQEPVAIGLPASALDALVGVYRIDPNATFTISRDGERLFSERSGDSKTEIFPESETRFFSKESLARLSFEKDASGRVVRLVFEDDSFEEPAVRVQD
jgi:CubicO group peptidase (beta-lactamase class C family)